MSDASDRLAAKADEVRELILDALRQQQPADQAEDGVDEWAFDYEAIVKAAQMGQR